MGVQQFPGAFPEDVPAASSAETYNGDGTLATVTELDSAGRTLKLTTLNYTAGVLTSVTEAAGGRTRTTSLTRTNGQLTSTAVS